MTRQDQMAIGHSELRRSLLLGAGAASFLAMNVAASGALAAPRSAENLPLPPKREPAAAVSSAVGTIAYSVPAGNLAAALTQWAETSRLRLLAPSAALRQLRTGGLEGNYAPEDALARLLEGTGLSWRRSGPDTVAVLNPTYAQLQAQNPGEPAIALDTIEVQGINPTAVIGPPPAPYAGGQVGSGARLGFLGNRSVFDTPFNQSSFTQKLIADQQATTLADIVRNDPAVRNVLPDTGSADSFFIRGLQVFTQDSAFDGVYGVVDQRRPLLEGIERVEILKGPGALLNGVPPQGTIGGAINLIPKRASDVPLTRVTTSYQSDAQLGTHVDLGRRFGANNEWGVRLNGVVRGGRLSIDDLSSAVMAGAAGLDYKGDRVRISADFGYQERNIDGNRTEVYPNAGFALPKAPKSRTNWNQPFEYYDSTHRFGVLKGEFDVTDSVTAYGSYGRSYFESIQILGTPTLTNSLGAFTQTPNFVPISILQESVEVGVRAKFETGPVSHRVSIAGSSVYRDTDLFVTPLTPAIVSNLNTPIRVPERSTLGLRRRGGPSAENLNRSIVFADTLSIWDERVQLTLGGRYQQIVTRSFNNSSGALTSRYKDDALTPAAAIVVKPLERLSLYANYIEGLQAGPIAPVTAVNAGEAFAPYVSRQAEVGAKYDFGALGVTLSAFQITKPSAFTNPATNRYGVDGEQRNQGIELTVFGEPMQGVRVLGGISLTEGKLQKTASPTTDGKTAPGVPEVQFNLYGEYDLPFLPGLTATGRVIYTSSQFYDQLNQQKIPAWTRFDLGARYTWEREPGKPVTLRATVENLLDKGYWESAASGLSAGAPRTFKVSASFDF